MGKSLVIVESPAKAKTINQYLGNEYVVRSSVGHVRDLPVSGSRKKVDPKKRAEQAARTRKMSPAEKARYRKEKTRRDLVQNMGINPDKGWEANYQILPDKVKVVNELQKLAAESDAIYLATDLDREGEAIAWHLAEELKLDKDKTKRIVFSEITKKAILRAIENPRDIDYNLVNAQQARRVLDRFVGYEISPVLWRKVKGGLSAGRVQSVSVRLIVEREREIQAFNTEDYFRVDAEFANADGKTLKAKLPKNLDTKKEAEDFLQANSDATFTVEALTTKPAKKNPAPPFTTSTLQQEAARKLYFSVSKTMNMAQRLYEAGLITYMRTDSTNISKDFQKLLKTHISEKYNDNYYYQKTKQNKKIKGAQEAHECIRVTQLNESLNDKYTDYDKKLYELIKKRTICSHMKPAIYDNLIYELINNELNKKGYFQGNYKVLIFDGYLKYSNPNLELNTILPDLPNEIYELNDCICSKIASNPPQYLNESSIVKKLEKSGIGRPSTYASIISTLYNRNYTEIKNISGIKKDKYTLRLTQTNQIKEKISQEKTSDQRKRIILTDLGKEVLDYLMKHFSMIINIEFTSLVEQDLDNISLGKIDWITVIQKVYNSFQENLNIQKSITKKPKDKFISRELGKLNKHLVILKTGKYGPYITMNKKNISLSYYLKDNPTDFNDITLDLIQEYIQYPIILGKYNKNNISIHRGPYGKYMKYMNKNYKIPQLDKYTLDRCISYIKI